VTVNLHSGPHVTPWRVSRHKSSWQINKLRRW